MPGVGSYGRGARRTRGTYVNKQDPLLRTPPRPWRHPGASGSRGRTRPPEGNTTLGLMGAMILRDDDNKADKQAGTSLGSLGGRGAGRERGEGRRGERGRKSGGGAKARLPSFLFLKAPRGSVYVRGRWADGVGAGCLESYQRCRYEKGRWPLPTQLPSPPLPTREASNPHVSAIYPQRVAKPGFDNS